MRPDLKAKIIAQFRGIAKVDPLYIVDLSFKFKLELVSDCPKTKALFMLDDMQIFNEVWSQLSQNNSEWWQDRHFILKVNALTLPTHFLQVFW